MFESGLKFAIRPAFNIDRSNFYHPGSFDFAQPTGIIIINPIFGASRKLGKIFGTGCLRL
jgi:hypothetical protein